MKFAVLSGAYKNAGDFLIVNRSIELLSYVYPGCEIKTYERRKSIKPYLDEINQCDGLIFAGGPAYSPNIYPNEIPLVDNLDEITTKIYTLGLGWYGINADERTISNYKFSEQTKKLLSRLEKDHQMLSCRDWYSVRVLNENGLNHGLMTGCPAWYNLDFVKQDQLTKGNNLTIKKICVSDPARLANVDQSIELVKFLKDFYPEAEITFVFHRGIKQDEFTNVEEANCYEHLKDSLVKMNIDIKDISYSKEGFDVYDDCDLHIGYRVHAHIYNLSRRNASILIEEDGRGAGVNDALGLPHILAYRYNEQLIQAKGKASIVDRCVRYYGRKFHGIGKYKNNPYVISHVEDTLITLRNNKYCIYRTAFKNMQMYFDFMIEHIKSFGQA